MCVFLYVRIYGLPLRVFNGQAKCGGIVILSLTPLKIDVHLLELSEKIINKCNVVNNALLFVGLQGHNQTIELLYHIKLLEDRVHIANTS